MIDSVNNFLNNYNIVSRRPTRNKPTLLFINQILNNIFDTVGQNLSDNLISVSAGVKFAI